MRWTCHAVHLPPDVFASDVRAMITLLHGCNDPRSDEERLLERLRAAGCNEAAVTALVECLDRESVDTLACFRAIEGLEMAGVSIGIPTIGEVHVLLHLHGCAALSKSDCLRQLQVLCPGLRDALLDDLLARAAETDTVYARLPSVLFHDAYKRAIARYGQLPFASTAPDGGDDDLLIGGLLPTTRRGTTRRVPEPAVGVPLKRPAPRVSTFMTKGPWSQKSAARYAPSLISGLAMAGVPDTVLVQLHRATCEESPASEWSLTAAEGLVAGAHQWQGTGSLRRGEAACLLGCFQRAGKTADDLAWLFRVMYSEARECEELLDRITALDGRRPVSNQGRRSAEAMSMSMWLWPTEAEGDDAWEIRCDKKAQASMVLDKLKSAGLSSVMVDALSQGALSSADLLLHGADGIRLAGQPSVADIIGIRALLPRVSVRQIALVAMRLWADLRPLLGNTGRFEHYVIAAVKDVGAAEVRRFSKSAAHALIPASVFLACPLLALPKVGLVHCCSMRLELLLISTADEGSGGCGPALLPA